MKRLIFLIQILFLAGVVHANETADSATITPNFNKEYFKSYWYDTRDVVLSPLHPTKNRLIGYGIAATGIGVLFTQDKKIKTYVQENRTSTVDWYSEHVFEPIGAGEYTMGLMGMFYLTGVTTKNKRFTKTALLGVKAYLISGALVRIPKLGFRRERPHVGEGDPNQWFSSWDHSSFISGHTTSAFSVATIIAKEYKSTIWVPILAYSCATLSGYSRINDNKHWASDVFGGALFGYGVASLIHNKNNWGVEVYPSLSSDGGGVSMIIPIQ